MRKFLPLLLCLAACRPESDPQASSDRTVPERPSRPRQSHVSSAAKPEPLLKTERVTVSPTGSAIVHATITGVEQAEAILEDLRTLPPSSGRDSGIANIIGDLAKVDPRQARRLLESWDDALIDKWLGAARTVARALAQTDPESAASFIEESVPSNARPGVWAQFLVLVPAAERVAYLDRIPDGVGKLAIAGDLVHVWLAEDPAACARWMDDFAVGRSAEELRDLGYSIHNSFSPAADTTQRLTALRTATDPEVRRLLANQLWEKADRSERAGLISELEAVLPDLAEHERKNLISDSPAEFAASLSSARIAELPAADMQSLIRSWSQKHPEAALAWAVENQRPEAAHALNPLYSQEPEKALALAATLTPGEDLDQALSSLCHMAAFDGRADAARRLVPLIQDPGQRRATLSNVERSADHPRR